MPAIQHRQKLKDLHLFAVDACVRAGSDRWWQRPFRLDAFADPAEGIEVLKDFCLHHLLYEVGDVAAFYKVYEIFEKEGFLKGDKEGVFLLELARYVKQVLREGDASPRERIYQTLEGTLTRKVRGGLRRAAMQHVGRTFARLSRSLAAHRRSAVVSVVILDDATATNFLEYCVPSLAGPRGLKVLSAGRTVDLLVFVKSAILGDVNRRLRKHKLGCHVVCRAIPPELSELAASGGGPPTDWLIGALQGLHLAEAKRLGADFCSVNPNAIYSDGFFENVLAIADRTGGAVLLAAVRANNADIGTDVERFRRNGSLVVPAGDLLRIGFRPVEPPGVTRFVADAERLRGMTSHLQLMSVEDDCVRIHATRHEIAFLAGNLLSRTRPRFFLMPGTEIDGIVASDTQPYFVGKGDHVAMLELAGSNSTPVGEAMSDVEFASKVGELTRERQAEYFKHPVYLQFTQNRDPSHHPQAVEAAHDAVFNAIDEWKRRAKPSAAHALSALHVLHEYELSEYGAENLGGAIDEARRLFDIGYADEVVDPALLKDLIRTAMNFDYVDKAIALAKSGQADTAFIHEFLVKMMELKAASAARAAELRAKSPDGAFAVVGSVAWGDGYVAKFLNYCLPSLLAAGNIPALSCKGKVVHSIVTTEEDRAKIVAHPAYARLSEFAEVVFTCFPAEFLQAREQAGYNFYYFYGLLDHQNVFLASALRADLYLLPIDCAYSNETLKNFSVDLEEGADCCSIAAIEADDSLLPWLDAKASGGVLDLVAEPLLQAACERPDAYFRSLVVSPDNLAFCAHPRELVWPLADGLAIHSIYMHPLATSARMLSRPFHPQHENVDSALLPRLLQGDGKLKIVDDARKVAIAHFGAPLARDDYLDRGFSLQSFIDAHTYDYAMQRRCFATRQFFPCRDWPHPPSRKYPDEVALIQSALVRNRFRAEVM